MIKEIKVEVPQTVAVHHVIRYQCDRCNAIFNSKNDSVDHMRTHCYVAMEEVHNYVEEFPHESKSGLILYFNDEDNYKQYGSTFNRWKGAGWYAVTHQEVYRHQSYDYDRILTPIADYEKELLSHLKAVIDNVREVRRIAAKKP